MHESQFGFMRGKQTSDPLLCVTEIMNGRGRENKKI